MTSVESLRGPLLQSATPHATAPSPACGGRLGWGRISSIAYFLACAASRRPLLSPPPQGGGIASVAIVLTPSQPSHPSPSPLVGEGLGRGGGRVVADVRRASSHHRTVTLPLSRRYRATLPRKGGGEASVAIVLTPSLPSHPSPSPLLGGGKAGVAIVLTPSLPSHPSPSPLLGGGKAGVAIVLTPSRCLREHTQAPAGRAA